MSKSYTETLQNVHLAISLCSPSEHPNQYTETWLILRSGASVAQQIR